MPDNSRYTRGMTVTTIPSYNIAELEQQASSLLQENVALAAMSPTQKIDYFSKRFLEHVYLAAALGEGERGQFDQSPPFRFDAFDCLTYVNTVLALALSRDLREFKWYMLRLNYYDAEPDYLKRYHFMSLDWNIQNQRLNILQDITQTFVDKQGKALYQEATTEINKSAWLRKRSVSDLKLLPQNKANAADLLQQLHDASSQFAAQLVSIRYIPLTIFFEHEAYLIAQIPDGAIIEIVRPGWDLSATIGTKLHVSHLGFAVRVNGVLMFRHASSEMSHVVEVLLRDYLHQRINSPTIKGINIHVLSTINCT